MSTVTSLLDPQRSHTSAALRRSCLVQREQMCEAVYSASSPAELRIKEMHKYCTMSRMLSETIQIFPPDGPAQSHSLLH